MSIRRYIIYFFHDTQKIPRKIYALFACLKGEMIAMKKHFHIQKYSPVSHLKLTFRIITLVCLQGTYGIETYQNLDV